MKKIVRQQNYLKGLIESQDNKFITKQILRCAIRAVLEPLLDNPEAGVVLYRIINQTGLAGLIKRVEFSDIEAYNFSDEDAARAVEYYREYFAPKGIFEKEFGLIPNFYVL